VSGVSASLRVDLALGGSYRQAVSNDAPTAWYRFAEQAGSASAIDSSGNARNGTIAGGVTLEEAPTIPEGGFAYKFDGVNGRLTVSLPGTGTTVTVEAWIKPNSPSGRGLIIGDAAGTNRIELDASRNLNAFYSAADHLSSVALADQTWSHVMVVISAGSGTFYINGVARGTFTAFPGFTPAAVGAYATSTNPLKGWLDELAVYPTALSGSSIAAHYAAGFWTDVLADLDATNGLSLKFGINGNGPKDRIADVGPLTFVLNNSAGNSAQTQGYYSPVRTATVRPGFTRGILARVVFTYAGTDYPRFIGKITSIDPEPGRYKSQLTRVQVHDLVDDLLETDLRNVTTQIAQTEAQLLSTLFSSLPVTSQPLAVHTDTGLDTSPFAFDNIGAGIKAVSPAGDIIMSSIGYLHFGPTGVARYENRQARQLKTSSASFLDSMIDLLLPTTLDGVFNHIRATYHPKAVDATATTVLYSLPVASSAQPSATSIAAGDTIDVWGDYFNPTNVQQRIGGTAQVAPVATTDYLANAAADGSGANKTANVTVVATFFASTVKFTITNSDVATVYITKLQCRGKGLYDNSPVTVESVSTQPYGDRPESIDMPYQSDFNTAQGLSDYLLSQFQALDSQIVSLTFRPNTSAAFMLAALSAQIGDRITITETQTGISMADVFIQSIQIDVKKGPWLTCTFGLSANTYFSQVWVMDDPVLSIADTSTIFGFA
jgi:hypothetical protein